MLSFQHIVNIKLLMRYFTFILPYSVFEMVCILHYSTFRLAKFDVLNSHMWQVAIILYSMGLKVFIRMKWRDFCIELFWQLPQPFKAFFFFGLFMESWLVSLWIDVGSIVCSNLKLAFIYYFIYILISTNFIVVQKNNYHIMVVPVSFVKYYVNKE